MSFSALLAHDLTRSYGARRVLDGISLTASPGQRIGLIGENGTGKSTLLRLLAGADQPDSGSVTRPADCGFLQQEIPFDSSATLADVLDDALREARRDLAELERLSIAMADLTEADPGYVAVLADYGDRLDRAQDHDAWDADRRAEVVLAGLGLRQIPLDRPLASLSGGQRGRLALAALLIRRPAALVLDEPTNHLDDAAAEFLEDYLCEFPGVVVLASHDRAFLEAACTDIVDLDPAVDGPTRYGGAYTHYIAQKESERQRWEQRFAQEQDELTQLRQAASTTVRQVAPGRGPRDNEKMGYGHTAGRVQNQVSRRVRDAARRIDELERTQVRKPPAPLQFRAPAPFANGGAQSDGLLMSVRHVRVPGRLAIDRLDIAEADRLLVTGPNGAGKSTLLAVLVGQFAGAGEVQRRRGLRVNLLAQDSTFDQPHRSAAQMYEAALGPQRAESVPLRSLGLIAPRDSTKPVGELSVGQRRRLALALLLADPPELLLLDEPTNHLSPRLADELESAFGSAPGAVVIASHDRWLRARWADKQLRLNRS